MKTKFREGTKGDSERNLETFARDLALGVIEGSWPITISVILDRDWLGGQSRALADYVQVQWNETAPSPAQLVDAGYLSIENKAPSVVTYRITDKAFRLIGTETGSDPSKVFVVHGRNTRVYKAVCRFLRSIGLHPIDWNEAVRATEEGSPYIGDVLKAGFAQPMAVVVLRTPDEEARLRPPYQGNKEDIQETHLMPQPRPNVLYEEGMAAVRFPRNTIVVQVGSVRSFSDTVGRHYIQLDGTASSWQNFALQLKALECSVNMESVDWDVIDNFMTVDLIESKTKYPRPIADDQWSHAYSGFWLCGDLADARAFVSQLANEYNEHTRSEVARNASQKLKNALGHANILGLHTAAVTRKLENAIGEFENRATGEWNAASVKLTTEIIHQIFREYAQLLQHHKDNFF